jgi:hypothetical protein
MTVLDDLRADVRRSRAVFEDAEKALDSAARRVLLAELLRIAREQPTIEAFELDVRYESDNEGGYFKSFFETVDCGDGEADEYDESWIEDLECDWTQTALLDLFNIYDIGENLLSVNRIRALAAAEKAEP